MGALFPCFDKIYTFDPVEAKEYKLKYLPNFYSIPRETYNTEPDIDACFIGSFQSYRLQALEELDKNNWQDQKRFFFHLYLPETKRNAKYNPILYQVCGLIKSPRTLRYRRSYELFYLRIQHNILKHHPLDLKEVVNHLSRSKCIIDLPYLTQSGSTHRVINALALKTKVITTNSSVVEDDFYSPEYIKIVSPKNIEIDWQWVHEKPQHDLQLDYLRLDNWLSTILSTD